MYGVCTALVKWDLTVPQRCSCGDCGGCRVAVLGARVWSEKGHTTMCITKSLGRVVTCFLSHRVGLIVCPSGLSASKEYDPGHKRFDQQGVKLRRDKWIGEGKVSAQLGKAG